MMYARIGIRSFWRQRRRNIFTLIAIMVGSAGLITLGGFINRWNNTLRYDSIYVNQSGTYSIYKKDGLTLAKSKPKKFAFSREEQDKIKKFFKAKPEVEFVGSMLTMQGLVSNGCMSYPFEIKGYDPQLATTLRSRPEVQAWCFEVLGQGKGLPFSSYQQKSVVGVSRGLAKSLSKKMTFKETKGFDPGVRDFVSYCQSSDSKKRIAEDSNLQLMASTLGGQFNAADVDIAHFYTTGTAIRDYWEMTAPLALLSELYDTDRISSFSIYYKNHDVDSSSAVQLQKQITAATGLEVDVYPWNDESISPVFSGIMGFLWMMGLFFALLIGSAVVLSVVNLTTISVMDRSREIGTLKALGYGTGSISLIFLFESIWIGLIGASAGLGLSMGCNSIINSLNIQYYPTGFSSSAQFWVVPDPLVTASVMIAVFLLVTVSSLVASYVLSKRSCLELLTHSGG